MFILRFRYGLHRVIYDNHTGEMWKRKQNKTHQSRWQFKR